MIATDVSFKAIETYRRRIDSSFSCPFRFKLLTYEPPSIRTLTFNNLFPPYTGIDLNANIGLDLVFVIDTTSSLRRIDLSTGLSFAKNLVRTIGASKRYDLHMIAGIES